MKSFNYVITDEIGIHARPAGLLVKEAKPFASKLTLTTGEKSADLRKLMAVMSLGVKCGQTVEVEISGADEENAYQGMKKFFEETL